MTRTPTSAAVTPEQVLLEGLLAAPLPAAFVSPAGEIVRVNERWAALASAPDLGALHAVPVETPEGLGRVVYAGVPAVEPGGQHVPEAAFRAAPVGMGVFDAEFRFTRVNDTLAAMFDLQPETLVGRSYREFLHAGERQSAEHRMQAAREGAIASGQVERRFVTAGGRTVWIRAVGVRATDGPDPTYFGVFLDVTERHEAEAERARLQDQVVHAERLRTLGQLAAGIAHEINNPTAIAIGGVDLTRRRLAAALTAARSGDLAGVRRHLENMESALRYCEDGTLRVAQSARRLGSFSALRAGRVERVDPNDLVRRAIELVRNELRHRARLVVELGDVPRLVGHGDRLVQVVTNLLVNAGQAIDGAPEAQAITVRTWTQRGIVCVSVADTGSGMSRDVRERLFEPFFTSRGKERGTGLGLTVVRDVVSQHRGRIDVWSEPGRGSRFTIELPLDNGLEATSADAPPLSGRVLVIDDEPFLLAVLGEILQAEHQVVTAGGGREALAILAEDSGFDAVLCDLMMPEVDGIDVHSWLVAQRPALAARTVFCTGGAFTSRSETYLTRTGLPVLAKPFTAEDVLKSIAEAAARGRKNEGLSC